MAPLAVRFYGDPSASLRVVGVTGTNGKTTTAFLVAALLEAAGEQCALLGTVKSVIGGREGPVIRTTPEAIDLQASFRAMLDARRPRLRDRGLLARARAAPRRRHPLRRGDLHQPDPGPPRLPRARWRTTSPPSGGSSSSSPRVARDQRRRPLRPPARRGAPRRGDVRARRAGATTARASCASASPARSFVATHPRGRARAAHAAARGASTSPTCSARSPPRTAGRPARARSPRRCPSVAPGAGPLPGARRGPAVQRARRLRPHARLARERAARRARSLTGGRLIAVFGCGGDRDRGKRPQMGADRGRARRPHDRHLRQPPLGGAGGDHRGDPRRRRPTAPAVEAIVDRREAIARAIALARAGDVVVIAGKGHERGQEFADGRTIPFDDARGRRAPSCGRAREGLERSARRRGGGRAARRGRAARAARRSAAAWRSTRGRSRRASCSSACAGANTDGGALRSPTRSPPAPGGCSRSPSTSSALGGPRRGRAARAPRTRSSRSARSRARGGASSARASSRSPARPARPRRRTSSPRCSRRALRDRREPAQPATPRSACRSTILARAGRHAGARARAGDARRRARSPS